MVEDNKGTGALLIVRGTKDAPFTSKKERKTGSNLADVKVRRTLSFTSDYTCRYTYDIVKEWVLIHLRWFRAVSIFSIVPVLTTLHEKGKRPRNFIL